VRDEAMFGPLSEIVRAGVAIHRLNKLSEARLGMSLVQWYLLRRLVELPAISAFELAKHTGVHPSTLTQTLKRLQRRGHVFVGEDPRDSRRRTISLTRQGKDALDHATSVLHDWDRNLAELGPQLVAMNLALGRFLGNANALE
jgi:DNA-binding MarR family transcriptional regulator